MADGRTPVEEAVFWALQRVMEDHDLAKLMVHFDCHNYIDPADAAAEDYPPTTMMHTLTVWSEPEQAND